MIESNDSVTIGVISDTHGLLRPEAIDGLQGTDVIIHAGDIGKPDIVDTLIKIAPLHCIKGNVDTAPWAAVYEETLSLQIAEKSVYVLHDRKSLDFDPVSAGIDLVIYGHSHKPQLDQQDGVTFLNPGSAGPRRFKLPVSIALVRIAGSAMSAEIVTLPLR